jgi:alkylation response protein AidB-like acyl-CoA dehydrogenase
MDFTWSEDEQALRAELRTYIAEQLTPGWKHLDRDMPTSATIDAAVEFCQGLADRGLLTPAWAKEDGGRGASKWAQVVISEELRGVGEPRGPQYANVNWLGPAIRQLGTEEQHAELLGPIAAGEALWCQGFSEPDAGSDLSALRTSAKRDGDHYIVNGQKIWTSYAHAADHCFLLVRTNREPNPRHGITVLLVPMDLDGIEVREIPTLGIHHMLHEVFFDDVKVPVGCRLGAENEGWNLIRSQPAAETLGRAAASAAASRILNYVAVQAWSDGSRDYPNHASVYKASAAQMAADAAQAHIAVLGAEALLESARGDYQLISAIESGIGGGSLEMQLNGIAWYVLGLPNG